MLQLGDKGAKQWKKILSSHKLRPRSMAIAGLDHLANPTRPEAYLDAR
jgi:hypothetical protein